MDDTQPKTTQDKPQLAVHEWLAVVVILSTLAMLTVISIMYSVDLPDSTHGEAHYLKSQIVEVFVTGAVELPGNYKISPTTLLRTVVSQAIPMKEADLKHFKGASKVRAGQVIHVPTKPQIAIHVSGAVTNSGQILVPRGSRLEDLGNYVQFSDEADVNKLRRKRILKPGEMIAVPKKAASL